MLKLALIAVGIAVLCRWALGKWPWDYLRPPSTRSQAIFRARKLLAVGQRASRAEIIAAHKRLVAMVHPDKGGSNAQVHEANAARDLLLDELPEEGTLP
ncbi:molecular chaperone DnaJ [Parerythrobacter lacustris]|uniref:Molecular chaperone DnaJ n=1 Tax=Parerythrobacter lacustris TaxID=2969984 RepID=A0ABT1XRM6_9SPHN|nr:molecular chaperone DnaJ [Parerythrobacter lacustris]MCR2834313.1 molecular chaperone DnaJ [Parerythrobacter lacustris]